MRRCSGARPASAGTARHFDSECTARHRRMELICWTRLEAKRAVGVPTWLATFRTSRGAAGTFAPGADAGQSTVGQAYRGWPWGLGLHCLIESASARIGARRLLYFLVLIVVRAAILQIANSIKNFIEICGETVNSVRESAGNVYSG